MIATMFEILFNDFSASAHYLQRECETVYHVVIHLPCRLQTTVLQRQYSLFAVRALLLSNFSDSETLLNLLYLST